MTHTIRVIDVQNDDAICTRCGDWGELSALHHDRCYGTEIARLAHEGN